MTRPRDADGNPVSYPSDNKPRTRKPGGAGPVTTQVTAIIPLELKARLDRCALVMGFSVSTVVREAVVDYLYRKQETRP